MKKLSTLLLTTFLTTITLFAAPQAVVFDFGGVLTGEPKKEVVIQFLRSSFDLSDYELEKINVERRTAIKAGKSDEEFWLQYASQHKIPLPANWNLEFRAVMKEAIGVNPKMYLLVAELRAKKIPVGLLSNIDSRLAKLVRESGFYEPFDPCLLSCEIGAAKPHLQAYEHLLSQFDFEAKEIVFIDDKQENVDAANLAGLDAILFQSEAQLRLELTKRELL